MTDQPYVLKPGDYGVVIRADGDLDVLLPPDTEDRPFTSEMKALLGAAIALSTDEEYRHLCVRRYDYEVLAGELTVPGVVKH